LEQLKQKTRTQEEIFSIIVPHAGYIFSGPCASHAYSSLKSSLEKTKEPITFIILGTDHTGKSSSSFSVSFEDFSTPLGIAKNNLEFSKSLVNNSLVLHDELPHQSEHSIEVQLPFLQYYFKNFNIVPVITSTDNYQELKKFSVKLSELVKKQKNPTVIIASGDFTHYGPNYGFIPFPFNRQTQEKLYNLDKDAIDKILELDSSAFFEKAKKSTICGISVITISIEFSKLLGAKKAKLLKYYTSGDIVHDYENSVSYASFVIEWNFPELTSIS